MRVCRKCGVATERYSSGECKSCARARSAAWKLANPGRKRELDKAYSDRDETRAKRREYERSRTSDPEVRRLRFARRIKYQFGLTPEQFSAMVVEQTGRCAACERPFERVGLRSAQIDHCHTGGHVRAVLCMGCNSILGLAQDDPATLIACAKFLRGRS